jgi:hypothetical protein
VTGPAAEQEPPRCDKCGKKLRTSESKRRGRGPVCDEKVNPSRGRDHSPRTQPARKPPETCDHGRPLRGCKAGCWQKWHPPSLLDQLETGP